MTSQGDGPSKVGDLVGAFLEASGLQAEVSRQEIVVDWPRLVGEGIAKVTHARSCRDGVLVVEVKSSAWLMELNLMKRDIIARVNAVHPESRINKLVFLLAENG